MNNDRTKLVARAQAAARESKFIEFKQEFDTASGAAWCELIKDIVAIANSGGGLIVFGVADDGRDAAADVLHVGQMDLANIANQIGKYTSTSAQGL